MAFPEQAAWIRFFAALIIAVRVLLGFGWKHFHPGGAKHVQLAH